MLWTILRNLNDYPNKYKLSCPGSLVDKQTLPLWICNPQHSISGICNPTQNAYIERFNRLFREDILDAYLFSDLHQVRELAWEWMDDYNEFHPHKSLGGISPIAYLKKMKRA
ncbi:integrase core domain-containing protein [Thermophagus sp. OGC60D27]